MKDIAVKAKQAQFTLFCGIIICLFFCIIALVIQMDGWQFFLIFSIVFGGACVAGVVFELRRPTVLIKTDKKTLFVYWKSKWQKILITDIVSVDFHNNKSGSTVLGCGRLILSTTSGIIIVYNIKNIRDVAFSIMLIINKEGENKNESS